MKEAFTRAEFLKRLGAGLKGLPAHTQTEILEEQNAHFEEGLRSGRSEAEVSAGLGDPDVLAQAFRAQARITLAESAPSLAKQGVEIQHAVFAVLVLAPLNLIFVLGPYLGIVGVLVAAWAVVGAGFLASLKVIGLAFGFGSSLLWAVSVALLGVALASIAVLFGVGMVGVTRICGIGTLAYLRWNYRMVTGRTSL